MRKNTKFIILSCAVVLLLLFVATPVAADVQAYNPLQDQARSVLIDQLNGTKMTSAEYIQTVWPEVYQKISVADKEKLASIQQVWKMESGTVVDGKTVALSSFRPERLAVMDAVKNLDITEAEYMQIVWPELYEDMSGETRVHLANTPNIHSVTTKAALSEQAPTRSSSLTVTVGTTFTVDRMYLKFNVSSRSNWQSSTYRPTYHYAESLIYDDTTNVKVGSTVAYADSSRITTSSPGENEIYNLNMVAHLPAKTYRADSMAYASTASYFQVQDTHTDYKYYPGWS